MYSIISNKIRIVDPSDDIKRYCQENLVLENPEFYKKEKMGKWTGNTQRLIYLFEKDGRAYILPFGCIRDIWKYIKKSPYSLGFEKPRVINYMSGIKLFDYQTKALEKALLMKNGVIVMPCGSGKTQTGLEIIARFGGRALWITHTMDLLNQSMNRAKEVYNLSRDKFGTITGGKINIGDAITFATVQTMVNIDLNEYKNAWDIIIVDECHKAIGSPTKVMQFYKVVSALCSRYKIGLTATPNRSDGLEASMFALLGGIIHEVTKEEVEYNTCPVKVREVKTGYSPENLYEITNSDGTLNYNKLIEHLTSDAGRKECVLNELANIPDGNAIMVFANRVEYLQNMCRIYNERQYGKGICLSGLGKTKADKDERKRALKALNDGEIDCIFATYQLAKEGLDVPNLRYLLMATPEKDNITVTQSAGRVARKFEGKEYGTIIDFVDDFGIFVGWAKKRKKIYTDLKYLLT